MKKTKPKKFVAKDCASFDTRLQLDEPPAGSKWDGRALFAWAGHDGCAHGTPITLSRADARRLVRWLEQVYP